MRTMLLSLAASLAALAPTRADELLPRSAFFAPIDKVRMQISPDGSRVGWIDPAEARLWIRALDEPAADRALDAAGVRAFTFAPDGRNVLLELESEHGTRVALAALDGGEPRALLPDARDARVVAVSPLRPDAAAIASDGALWRVALTDGAAEELARDPRITRWLVDAQLVPRAGRSAHGDGYTVYVPARPAPHVPSPPAPDVPSSPARDVAASDAAAAWTALHALDWEQSRVSELLSVSADGRELYAVDARGRDKSALKAYDLESGAERVLLADPFADVVPGGATIDPRTGAVQAVVAYFPRMRRGFADAEVELDFRLLESVHPGDVSFAGQSDGGRRWLVRFMDGGPLDHYVWDRDAKRATPLFGDVSALEGVALAPRRPLLVPASDGLALPCDLYLPVGSDADGDGVPDRPLPTVYYVHGGPWVGFEWNNWFTNRSFQLLANRGYAVVRTEFRSAVGYGRRFMDAGDLEWGERILRDVLDVADWTVERGIADRERRAIWGWSFGGYQTHAALAFESDAFACGLSMYGLSDLVRFTDGLIAAGAGRLWVQRVGDPRTPEGRALLERHSPLFAAERVTRPLLVTHGALDARVPQEQSDLFVAALAERDHPVTYVVYPNEPHDYRSAASWIAYWAIAERFLHEHLGGRYEPYGDDVRDADLVVAHGAAHVPGLGEALGG